MHERALMEDIVRQLETLAIGEPGCRVTRVRVRLGALSHFTPAHFREHFEDATRGTLAEGAGVVAVVDRDTTGPRATGVVVESVELEVPDPGEPLSAGAENPGREGAPASGGSGP